MRLSIGRAFTLFGAVALAGSAVSLATCIAALHKLQIGAATLSAAAIILGVWLMRRKAVEPLSRMTRYLTELAAGNIEAEVPCKDRDDEIGDMARSAETVRAALVERERERLLHEEEHQRRLDELRSAERAAVESERWLVAGSIGEAICKLASQDLTRRLDDELPEAYRFLQADLNTTVDRMGAALKKVSATSRNVQSGTHEIAIASDNLSRRTEQAAASLEQSASSLEEITGAVRKTAEGAKRAHDIVCAAKGSADASTEVVRQAISAMGEIERSSKQVSQIVGMIDEIAFQTNLLALNAGVEAARAGDAGKGFAVVASEVRALAQRSTKAAKEIDALISTSNAQITRGAEFVSQTGKALDGIGAEVAAIDKVVSEIAVRAREQASSLQQVNAAIEHMDQLTQQNAAMAQQAAAAGRSLAEEGRELAQIVSQFKLGEDNVEPIRGERATLRLVRSHDA